jgi:hypothetical protein
VFSNFLSGKRPCLNDETSKNILISSILNENISNMNTWYTVKVKYTKQLEDGRLKRVTEPYLVDAQSFTDAEARIYYELGSSVQGEFLVTGITKTDFADIFHYDDADDWYKCKLTYVTMDADSGKEKQVSNNFLVSAHNVKDAFERIHESMSDMLVSFEIPSIMLSPIVEIFPYDSELEKVMGLTPMAEIENKGTQDELEEDHFEQQDVDEHISEGVNDKEEEDAVDSSFEDENEKE